MSRTTTKTRERAAKDEELKARATESDDDDDDDEEEEEPQAPRGRAARSAVAADDLDDEDDDELDDDDEDDSIIIDEGWEEAAEPTGQFPYVKRGPYIITLTDTDVRRAGENAKNPGSKYGVLVVKINAEDNPDKMDEDAPTVTIWHSLFFTKASYGRTKKFARAMGVQVSVGDDIMASFRELADDEAKFEAVIGEEKYKADDEETGRRVSRTRNKILRVIGPVD